MSLVERPNTKPVIMLSTVDLGNPDITASITKSLKAQDIRVEVRVSPMVQRYNMFMRGTDRPDEKTTVYVRI